MFVTWQAAALDPDPDLDNATAELEKLAEALDGLATVPDLVRDLPTAAQDPAQLLRLLEVFDDTGDPGAAAIESLKEKLASITALEDPAALQNALDELDEELGAGLVLSVGGPGVDGANGPGADTAADGKPTVTKDATTKVVDIEMKVSLRLDDYQVPIDFATEVLDLGAQGSGGKFAVDMVLETSTLHFRFDPAKFANAATSQQALALLTTPQPTISLAVTANDAELALFDANLGFTSVDVAGVFDLNLAYGLSLQDPDDPDGAGPQPGDGQITADELVSTAAGDLIKGGFTGTGNPPALSATVVVDSDLINGDGVGNNDDLDEAADPPDTTADLAITLTADTLTSGVDVAFDGNADVLDFQNFSAEDALGALARLVALLDGLQATGALDFELPFIDGLRDQTNPADSPQGTFSDALRLAEELKKAIDNPGAPLDDLTQENLPNTDIDETGKPDFPNAQTLLDKVNAVLAEVLGATATLAYDPATRRLTYDLDINDAGAGDVALDFGGLDILSAIRLTTDGTASGCRSRRRPRGAGGSDRERSPGRARSQPAGARRRRPGDGGGRRRGRRSQHHGRGRVRRGRRARPRLRRRRDARAPHPGVRGHSDTAPDGAVGQSRPGCPPDRRHRQDRDARSRHRRRLPGHRLPGRRGRHGPLTLASCADGLDNDSTGGTDADDPDCRAGITLDIVDDSVGGDGWLTIRELFNAIGYSQGEDTNPGLAGVQAAVHYLATNLDAGIDARVPVGANLGSQSLGTGQVTVTGDFDGPIQDAAALVNDITIDGQFDSADFFSFSPCSNTEDDDGDGTPNDGCEGGPAAVDAPESNTAALFDKIVDAIRLVAEQLEANGIFPAGTLDQELPLLGVSIGDALALAESLAGTAEATEDASEDTLGGCANNADEDGDGVVNDGCPATAPAGGEPLPESDCIDVTDDNGDNLVNAADADDDGDGTRNDGCQPETPSVQDLADAIADDLERYLDNIDQATTIAGDVSDAAVDASIAYDAAENDLRIKLNVSDFDYTLPVPFAFDLPGDLGSIVDLAAEGTTNLVIDSASLRIGLGVDLDDFAPFITGDSYFGLPARASGERLVFTAGVGSLRVQVGQDADDATPEDAGAGHCDAGNTTDEDGDGFLNDGCPGQLDAESGRECGDKADDDGDGIDDDGCGDTDLPAKGDPESEANCKGSENEKDNDGDGDADDGCPADPPAEPQPPAGHDEGGQNDPQCAAGNIADEDGDGFVNDGCPARPDQARFCGRPPRP